MPITSGSVPKHATYVQGGLPVGLDSRRRNVRLIPQAGPNGYNDVSSNIIRIDLPPSIGFLDTQASYLRFRIKVKDDEVDVNNGPCRMDANSMSWCHRFEIISNNGSVLESIENYNLLSNLLHSATSPGDYRETAGKLLDNQGSKAERAANMACKSGKMYCAGLDCSGILGGNSKYLPCQFIQGSLTMEFHLASFAECFTHSPVSAGGRGQYHIEDVEFVAECLQFGQDFNMVFEQQLRTSGVDIAYHTYRAHTQSILEGNEQTIQISQNSKSVKGCYCVMRDKNKYRSDQYDSLSTYKSCNLQDFQFDLGGRLFPEGRLQIAGGKYGNAYASNLNSFNHFRDHGGGSAIDRTTFNASQNEGTFSRGTGETAYLANSTKRMYGKIASGVEYYAKALDYTQGDCRHLYTFGTIFQPDDLDDLGSFKIGERYKVSTKNKSASVPTDALETSLVTSSLSDKATTMGAVGDTTNKYDEQYLYVIGHGDVKIPHTTGTDGSLAIHGYALLTGCVHFCAKNPNVTNFVSDDNYPAVSATNGRREQYKVGAPIHANPFFGVAKTSGAKDGNISLGSVVGAPSILEVVKTTGAKLAAPTTTDGTNIVSTLQELIVEDRNFSIAGTTEKARFVWHSCVMDQVPDDSKFYIGMSFETHDEHESMVSGTDLTNTVPLHLNLKFDTSKNAQESNQTGDIITSFIHYDCILRIEPDGNVVSSA